MSNIEPHKSIKLTSDKSIKKKEKITIKKTFLKEKIIFNVIFIEGIG